jgi:hypothetical protein
VREMAKKVKVRVWGDEFGLAAYRPMRSGYPYDPAGRLVLLGTVEIETVGVIWGTREDVERETRERVEQAAKNAGLL